MSPVVRSLSALCAASLLALPAAAQQLYKYVGPDGRVQYSDQPPTNGQKAEKVTSSRVNSVPSGASAAPASPSKEEASGPKSTAEQEQAFRKRRMEAEEKERKEEKLAEEKRARAEACGSLRRNLAGMQSGGRIVRSNESGERVYLDDAQVQQDIARLQREISANCN